METLLRLLDSHPGNVSAIILLIKGASGRAVKVSSHRDDDGIMENRTYPAKVGEDRIFRRGEKLLVCSKVDMDEWQVQQTRKTAIYINDEAWCLVGKQYTAAKEVRYLLDPWPNPSIEIPGRRIRYDEEYVRARNEAEKKGKIASGIGPILCHLSAFIGFLPSRVKTRIESDFGVSARNATFASIIVELFLFFVLGALLQILVYGAMRAPQLVIFIPPLIVLVPVLFVDMVMRYHNYLREDASPWGLFEWVVKACQSTSFVFWRKRAGEQDTSRKSGSK
jgi:hypothetical protein